MCLVFLLLCVPGNLDCLPDTVDTTFSDAGYFCIPIHILELCSEMQLSYLGTV